MQNALASGGGGEFRLTRFLLLFSLPPISTAGVARPRRRRRLGPRGLLEVHRPPSNFVPSHAPPLPILDVSRFPPGGEGGYQQDRRQGGRGGGERPSSSGEASAPLRGRRKAATRGRIRRTAENHFFLDGSFVLLPVGGC